MSHRMTMLGTLAVVVALFGVAVPAGSAEARTPVREAASRAWGRIFARDAARDAAIAARPLPRPQRVWRYTDQASAERAAVRGLPPSSHMTAGTTPGRLPSPATAQARYGLARPPEVRMTVELPRGLPVRRAKALAGAPGVGEVTSPSRVPPQSVVRIDRLPGTAGRSGSGQ